MLAMRIQGIHPKKKKVSFSVFVSLCVSISNTDRWVSEAGVRQPHFFTRVLYTCAAAALQNTFQSDTHSPDSPQQNQ